jgi:glycine oxidase
VKITVVGAGIIGCAVAYELVSRGAQVLVIDHRGVSQGATKASAGILAPYIEGHIPSLRMLGLSSLALYDDFIERVRTETSIAIEYERSGTLHAALTDEEALGLAAIARDLRDAREGHSLIDAREARRLEPLLSARVVAALLVPRHGYVAAAALTTAIAEAARSRGAEFSSTRAIQISNVENVVSIETPGGRLESDALILAAGSWSSAIETLGASPAVPAGAVPWNRRDAVKPIRGQLVQLSTTGRTASHVIWRGQHYLVPWRDGTVLVGATIEDVGFDDRATAGGVQTLLDAATELMPELRHATLREARAGLRPATPDELPVIGRSSTMRNVFYATGHYRNGVLLAPLTAALVADLVIGGCARAELELVRPDRFGL